jgi:uncharacterized protein
VRIEGKYTVDAPPDRVFPLLVDEAVLRRCIPGCRRLVRESEDRFGVSLDVGLGAVQGTYEGTVTLSQKVPPERLEMIVEGQGKLGFVRGKAWLQLAPAHNGSESTLITYQADVQVGGTIAGVGQRMIQGTAKMMAGQFLAAFEAEAKAAQSAQPISVKHGRVRNFLRWLRSIIRDLLQRRAPN